MKKYSRILAVVLLAVLAFGVPAARATDKAWITFGPGPEKYIHVDGMGWRFELERWRQDMSSIANAGTNRIRIWPYSPYDLDNTDRKSVLCPYQLAVGDVWDLTKFNPEYFRIYGQVIDAANEYGLTVELIWFDACQLHTGYWTFFSPWKHNIQGVGSFYDKAADKASAAWVREIFRRFPALEKFPDGRPKMFHPWGNELDQPQYPEWAKRVIFPLAKELKIPYEIMAYGATMTQAEYLGEGKFGDKFTFQDEARKFYKDYAGEANALKVAREVHKCGTTPVDKWLPFGHRPAQAAAWWTNNPVGPWEISDDGVHEINNPTDGGRPDPARWKAMAAWAFPLRNMKGVEHLDEGGPIEYQVTVMEAIASSYFKTFGAWPQNRGKWTYVPPVVEPDPDPDPQPEPEPEPGNSWLKNNWGYPALGILIVIAIAVVVLARKKNGGA